MGDNTRMLGKTTKPQKWGKKTGEKEDIHNKWPDYVYFTKRVGKN